MYFFFYLTAAEIYPVLPSLWGLKSVGKLFASFISFICLQSDPLALVKMWLFICHCLLWYNCMFGHAWWWQMCTMDKFCMHTFKYHTSRFWDNFIKFGLVILERFLIWPHDAHFARRVALIGFFFFNYLFFDLLLLTFYHKKWHFS